MEEDVRGRWPSLFVMTLVYVVGELSHFLLGIVTRPMSQDIHYGSIECLANTNLNEKYTTGILCYSANSSKSCEYLGSISNTNESACVWDYSGLGLEYQILAGPCFIAVFTVSGIIMGIVADRYSRHSILSFCLLLLVTCTTLSGAATHYWHLVVLRMGIGAGESVFAPACSSMISDLFSPARRGLALGIFNWGIYFGYGISYAIGNFVTKANILDMGWRWSYYVAGAFGGIVVLLLLFVAREPTRKREAAITCGDIQDPSKDEMQIKEEANKDTNENSGCQGNHQSLGCPDSSPNLGSHNNGANNKCCGGYNLIYGESGLKEVMKAYCKLPIILLTIAACVRHTAGFTWGYNTQLYYTTYFPNYNLGVWISVISIVGGALGVAIGGFASDTFTKKLGLRARTYVLALSQFLATPLAVGVLYFSPPVSFYFLLATYFFAEMWFGVVFAILTELIPPKIHTTSIALFLFIINNVGGNAPLLITPLRKTYSYRIALLILYPGFYFLSSLIFFATSLFISPHKSWYPHANTEDREKEVASWKSQY